MRRLFIIMLIAIVIIGGAAFLFPMRLAVNLAGLDRAGLSARQIEGTIWSGRMVDAQFRGINLGDLDAGIVPSSLLSAPAIQVRRLYPQGEDFTATISGSAQRLQVQGAKGDIPLNTLAGRIPVSKATISGGDIILENGRCVSATGDVTVRSAGLLTRVMGDTILNGNMACQGDNMALELVSENRNTRLSASLDPDRRYQMQLMVSKLSPQIAFALRAIGLQQDGDGLTIGHSGVLR